ncbi:hypothetical protein ACFFOV_15920 [Cerasicoccus arenae]|nr:hypothetical protein [Cerasicoccus arenae]
MQKIVAILLLALAPSLSLAHGTNDLSHGHAHWLFSLHHLLGLIIATVIAVAAIWWFTRPKPKMREAKVRVHNRRDRRG